MSDILGRALRRIAIEWQRREVSAARRALAESAQEARDAETQADESARLAQVDAMRVRVARAMEAHCASMLHEAEADLDAMRRDA
jgi:hypothetical protein